jgi:hypothetical protein
MTCRLIALAALLSTTLAAPATAQDANSSVTPDTVDVRKLPVDLQRIQRQLRRASVREERDGLNLRYFVDVYGQAPRIELFSQEDREQLTAPAPYGAPTHREMIEAVTPKEYRAPAADFSALFRWLADKSKK